MQKAVQITHVYMYTLYMYKKFSNLIGAYRITPIGEYVTYCSHTWNSSIINLVSCYGQAQENSMILSIKHTVRTASPPVLLHVYYFMHVTSPSQLLTRMTTWWVLYSLSCIPVLPPWIIFRAPGCCPRSV